jgi:hypothetical protein
LISGASISGASIFRQLRALIFGGRPVQRMATTSR